MNEFYEAIFRESKTANSPFTLVCTLKLGPVWCPTLVIGGMFLRKYESFPFHVNKKIERIAQCGGSD